MEKKIRLNGVEIKTHEIGNNVTILTFGKEVAPITLTQWQHGSDMVLSGTVYEAEEALVKKVFPHVEVENGRVWYVS